MEHGTNGALTLSHTSLLQFFIANFESNLLLILLWQSPCVFMHAHSKWSLSVCHTYTLYVCANTRIHARISICYKYQLNPIPIPVQLECEVHSLTALSPVQRSKFICFFINCFECYSYFCGGRNVHTEYTFLPMIMVYVLCFMCSSVLHVLKVSSHFQTEVEKKSLQRNAKRMITFATNAKSNETESRKKYEAEGER